MTRKVILLDWKDAQTLLVHTGPNRNAMIIVSGALIFKSREDARTFRQTIKQGIHPGGMGFGGFLERGWIYDE